MGELNPGYKIVRDPLYGYIGLTRREVELLDTVWLQRLRRIKQLAMTELVYPSAVHTRFEHSLGVLHVADMMALQLKLCDRDREVVRAAGLLHDIGHGPFSHVFENVLEIANDGENELDHEKIIPKILKTKPICSILSSGESIFEDVFSLFADQKSEYIVRNIISSSLDADKLDYLMRDSYHTGVMYGVFDFNRIVRMLDSVESQFEGEDYIVVREKGEDALVSFLLARYLMHKQVYQHHVRAITDSMIVRAAKLHIEKSQNTLRVSDASFLSNFCNYDDFTFLHELGQSPSEDARELVQRLKERRLLKRCYKENMENMDWRVVRQISKMGRSDFEKLATSMAQAAYLNPNFIIVYPIRIENPVYKDPDRYFEGGEIIIKNEEGKTKPFAETSPIFGSPEKYVQNVFVFCPAEGVGRLKGIAEEAFQPRSPFLRLG